MGPTTFLALVENTAFINKPKGAANARLAEPNLMESAKVMKVHLIVSLNKAN